VTDESTPETEGGSEVHVSGGGSAQAAGGAQLEVAKANPPRELQKKLDNIRAARAESDLGLSKAVGYGTLGLMAVQVIIVDGGFLFYGFDNNWKIPAGAIVAWLGVGTIQVIGSVVLVVARDLFPGRKEKTDG
jgi:hypothetical protein